MPPETTPQSVAPVIAEEFKRLASVIQNADPKWRGNDCIDTRGGKIDPQERAGELIIQAVECGLLRQVPKLHQLVMWAKGGDRHPLDWPFAEGDARANSYDSPYKRCPRNVFNTVVGERQRVMTVFPPEVEAENEYYERRPERRVATRQNPNELTPHERDLREQVRLATERECKKPCIWPLPPHGLLSEFLPSMFPPGDDKSRSNRDEAVMALHERNDRYARACLVLAALSDLQDNRQVQESSARLRDAAKGIETSSGVPVRIPEKPFVAYHHCFAGVVSHSPKDHTWSANPADIAGVVCRCLPRPSRRASVLTGQQKL